MKPSRLLGRYYYFIFLVIWLSCCCLNRAVVASEENHLIENQQPPDVITANIDDNKELMLRKSINDEVNGKHLLIIPWTGV